MGCRIAASVVIIMHRVGGAVKGRGTRPCERPHLQPGLELLAGDLAVPVDVEGLEGRLQVLRLVERCQIQRASQELLCEAVPRTAVGIWHVVTRGLFGIVPMMHVVEQNPRVWRPCGCMTQGKNLLL